MGDVRRRRSVWLVAGPLLAAASLLAHSVAYQVAHAFAGTGADDTHGYLSHLSLAAAPATVLMLMALAARVFTSRGQRASRLPWAPFVWLPAVAFALQEHLERIAATGAFPVATATQPTFALGLVLGVPFGLAAYAVTRALLGSADRISTLTSSARAPGIPLPQWALLTVRPAVAQLLPFRILARPTGRAPPVAA